MAEKNIDIHPDEVHITHVFDAARERVFAAWTDPEQLVKWFAPDGCTISFRNIDIREGGGFHSCVQSPGQRDCWCKGRYLLIDAPHRIIFTMAFTDASGNDVRPSDAGMPEGWPPVTKVTVDFTEADGKTKLTLHQEVPESIARATGAYMGWVLMFNRLYNML